MVGLLGLSWKKSEKRAISLSQKVYVEKALHHTEISVFKPVHSLTVWIDFKKNLEVPADEELCASISLTLALTCGHTLIQYKTRSRLCSFYTQPISIKSYTQAHGSFTTSISILAGYKRSEIVYRGGLTNYLRREV